MVIGPLPSLRSDPDPHRLEETQAGRRAVCVCFLPWGQVPMVYPGERVSVACLGRLAFGSCVHQH